MKLPGKNSINKAKEKATAFWQRVKTPASEASLFANLLLSTKEVASPIAGWFAETFNRSTDIYDKAIDALYNATHVGGSKLHHIVDGQHSFLGALRAVENVSQTDSKLKEIAEATEHLLRDLCSKSGINPFVQIKDEHYKVFSNWFSDTFHVSKDWIADALTVNSGEVLGACFAVVPIILGWKRSDAERFTEIAGNLGVPAAVSANPLLGILVFVTLARAYTTAKSKEEKTKAKMGLLKGSSASLVFVGTSSIVGGPVWIGIVGGMILAHLARKRLLWDKMSEQLASYAVSVNKLLIAPYAENLRGYLTSVKTLPASLKSRLANLRQVA
jgi:hypothetical protein